jgi:hypothetical protein
VVRGLQKVILYALYASAPFLQPYKNSVTRLHYFSVSRFDSHHLCVVALLAVDDLFALWRVRCLKLIGAGVGTMVLMSGGVVVGVFLVIPSLPKDPITAMFLDFYRQVKVPIPHKMSQVPSL